MVAFNFDILPEVDTIGMQIRFHVFRVSGIWPPQCMFASTMLRAMSGKREFFVIGKDGNKVRVCLELQADGQYNATVCGSDATTGSGNSLVVRLPPTYDSSVDATAVTTLPPNPAREVCDTVGLFLEHVILDPPFPVYYGCQSVGGPIVSRYSLARLTGSADDYFCFDCSESGRQIHLHLRLPGDFSLGEIAPIQDWDCDMLTIRLLDGTSSLDAMQRKKPDRNGRKVIELAFDTTSDCGETVMRVMDVISTLSVYLAAASSSSAIGVGSWV